MGIRIKATGSYVPEKILTNQDLEKMVDTSDEWIRTRTGIEERHIATADQSTADMAFIASQRALEMAGIKAEEIDAIIFATITPDYIFPNTACVLQDKLGAKNAFCFDIEAACSGLLYSLEVGFSLMLRNKKFKHVLVLGAEKLSSLVDWNDRNTCVLFGDGAAAVILENDGTDAPDKILTAKFGSDGKYGSLLNIEAGGSRLPVSEETLKNKQHYIHMEGKEVFKLAVNAMVGSSKHVLEEAGIAAEEVSHVVPHQANMRIIDAVAQRLDIPAERVYKNVNRYGNTSAASIGLCLDEMNRSGLLKEDQYVLLTAFGGGMTWGALLLRW